MSIFTTHSAAQTATPIDPISGFAGNTVTPFSYGVCPCHQAVERSRNLIGVQQAATRAVCERLAEASARAKGIVWTGNAANLFRSRLDELAKTSQSLTSAIETTHQLAWS
ncbi:hypothetical protein [Bifidobacterium cebidarum]|uniref:Uncharacterized protein n=1 Tax=Bifidobacterium cebidarum TaxID=2650773 RepID=A0A6I1GBU8_9BIFI|nr:hypothetical protein [Bifidobacterium cebidarum]KAB7789090.1 hypothetical protein F7D08_0040 [Bifidobacterium cebidarum]